MVNMEAWRFAMFTVFPKGEPVKGRNPEHWRKASNGRIIKRDQLNNDRSVFGWRVNDQGLPEAITTDQYKEAAKLLLADLLAFETDKAKESSRLDEIRNRYSGDDALTEEGEVRSIIYFEENAIAFKRNFPLGKSKIDFLIERNGQQVLLEAADIDVGERERTILNAQFDSLLDNGLAGLDPELARRLKQGLQGQSNYQGQLADVFDPFPRIQKILQEKDRRQLRQAKGLFPTIVVIFNQGGLPYDDQVILKIGMGNRRYFPKGQRTAISAFAILEKHNGKMRLRIHSNPDAALPLPEGFFGGEYDVLD